MPNFRKYSNIVIAKEYGSCPVAQAADHILIFRLVLLFMVL